MCVCMCVCVCVCVCIFIYTHRYMHECMHIYTNYNYAMIYEIYSHNLAVFAHLIDLRPYFYSHS